MSPSGITTAKSITDIERFITLLFTVVIIRSIYKFLSWQLHQDRFNEENQFQIDHEGNFLLDYHISSCTFSIYYN